MLDIKAVRQDPEGVATALKKRGFNLDVAAFRALGELLLEGYAVTSKSRASVSPSFWMVTSKG